LVGAASIGRGIDGLYQRPSRPGAARGFGHEPVFKMVPIGDRPRHPVIQVVHDTDHLAGLVFGNQVMHALRRIQQARPGDIRDLGRKLGFVEFEIALP
tara:strand:+ start:625 stop:918 length:294 start_codon:yes stop_codon:yes gene_type:complete